MTQKTLPLPETAFQPPLTNRGVQISAPTLFPSLMSAQADITDPKGGAFFDWYQATVETCPYKLRDLFLETFGGTFEECGSINNYAEGVKHSHLTFTIFWGGHNPSPNIKATGGDSQQVADWVRKNYPVHKVSRADVAYDFSFNRSFDVIAAIIEPIARQRGVSIKLLGDPAENCPDFPEEARKGRTLYLGSRTSEVRLRLYEKGFERRVSGVKDIDPNLTRLEVVIAPQKAHKAQAATLTPFQMVGFSKWVSGAIEAVIGKHPALIPTNIKRDTSTDERLVQLTRQYGRTLIEYIEEKGWKGLTDSLSIMLFDYDHPKRLTPSFKEKTQ